MSAPTHPLRQTRLSSVGLSTPDVERSAAFYERTMGLTRHPSQATHAGAVKLGFAAGHHALELLPGPARLDHFALEVADAGGPEAIAERLRERGVPVEPLADPGGFLVHDPDGNAVRLHGPLRHGGEHTADTGRRPVRVQHVTLGTAELEPMVDFYVGLGFTITDRMGQIFTWLRSNTEHHSVAVVDVGHSGGLDHYSWDLSAWDDFKVWADRLTDIGVQVQWGPGRHGPGNNLFLFFDDTDGNHVELSAEMERFFDDRAEYPARTWEPAPTTVNLWGGQVPGWRDAKRGG
jgi:catechol 2,3-dioxygenase